VNALTNDVHEHRHGQDGAAAADQAERQADAETEGERGQEHASKRWLRAERAA
jgi:hypothetical protein